MNAIFHHDINLDGSKTAWLEHVVRQCHPSPSLSMSVRGLGQAASTKMCGIIVEDKLASFAWYMPRTCHFLGRDYSAISIGLVTTLPQYRKQGLASFLLNSLADHARNSKVDFLYLAGIPHYYEKLGFKGIAPKSKFVFTTSNIPPSKGSIIPLEENQLAIASQLYEQCRIASGGFAKRSKGIWHDLLGPLSTTFLYYKPSLVLNDKGVVIACFSTSPDNPSLIREFIPSLEPRSVERSLGVIAQSPNFSEVERIDIFAPFQGPVLHEASQALEADFMCFLRPRSSNMLKWLSEPPGFYNGTNLFIYQGDNL